MEFLILYLSFFVNEPIITGYKALRNKNTATD